MTEYVLSLSYGKDSLACLAAIEQLGWPLDRIVHAEVWATDTIPADLPPMVEFKAKADRIIKERWGIEVEHIYAVRGGRKTPTKECSTGNCPVENLSEPLRGSLSPEEINHGANTSNTDTKLTYESIFYRPRKSLKGGGRQDLRLPDAQGELVYERPQITGFATKWSQYCTGELKVQSMDFQSRYGGETGVRPSKPPLSKSPARGADKKYRAISRHSCR